MSAPQAVTGAPPGLEYLGALDQIIVKQRVELLESTCILIEMKGIHLFYLVTRATMIVSSTVVLKIINCDKDKHKKPHKNKKAN